MSRASRWPTAAACLGFGAVAATVATDSLRGQPVAPLPPPVGGGPTAVGLPPALPAPEVAIPPAGDPVSFRDVVKRALPAVVNIDAKAADRKPAEANRRGAQLPPGVAEDFRRFFEPSAEPVPRQPDSNLGFGSGVIVDPMGVILTNYHVVEGAESVEITLQDGRTFPSRDIRTDPKTDLAIVLVTTKEPLPALAFGDSDAMEVGDRVLAVGAPFGLAGSVTHGIISAKSRRNLRLNEYEDFLQTDAAINPGNSGGPLIGLDGKLIGINSAIKTRSGGFQGVGLAISSNLARDVVAQLMKDGVVRRGYLGVSVRPIDAVLAQRLGTPAGVGVVVSKLSDGSPAAKAGIQIGDAITAVAGTPIKELNTLAQLVAKLPIGKPALLTVIRDRQPLSVTVAVEELRDERERTGPELAAKIPQPVPLNRLGLTVADLTPDVAAQLGYPRELRGAVVVSVERNWPAAEAGLVRGRVVIKVDRTLIATVQELTAALAAADPERGALLQIVRPTGELDFAVLRVK